MKRQDEPKHVSTRVGYAKWASHYDEHDNPMIAMVEHVLSGSQASPPASLAGADVLELGCGTGRNALAFQAMGCTSYLGIDNSPEMLAVANAQFPDQPGIEFANKDLSADWMKGLPTFDVAFVSLVLEHFSDIRELVAKIGRVVANGGLLWCLEIHPERIRAGGGAHVSSEEGTFVLPSFQHGTNDFIDAFAHGGWQPIASTDWYATDEVTQRSQKLSRYRGQPVLLEIRARRVE